MHTTCSGQSEMPRKTSHRNMNDSQMRPFDEKEWGMTREQLHDGMRRFGENGEWCHSHEDGLRGKYPDQWIVVEDGKVIMADADHDQIVKKLMERPAGRGSA